MYVRAIITWVRMRRLSKLGIASLVALVLAGVSAHAAIRAIVGQHARTASVPRVAVGYDAEDHFPGGAYLYAVDETAPEAATLGADATIRPAAPFSMAKASATDRGRALQCLTTAIYYEAASEPDAGQQAVAQVVLNRVRHPAFPATVCGVVFQGSEHSGCQFSFACDGAMNRGTPARAYWARAAGVAAAALNGRVMGAVGLATHYHTYAVTPSWNRSLVMTAAIGAHFFHRWQGYWGTPGAFRQGYAGGEPVPGPHTPIAAPLILAVASGAVPPPPAAPAAIQPAYAQSGTPVVASMRDALPGDSKVLDRWKDSGKPLR